MLFEVVLRRRYVLYRAANATSRRQLENTRGDSPCLRSCVLRGMFLKQPTSTYNPQFTIIRTRAVPDATAVRMHSQVSILDVTVRRCSW